MTYYYNNIDLNSYCSIAHIIFLDKKYLEIRNWIIFKNLKNILKKIDYNCIRPVALTLTCSH